MMKTTNGKSKFYQVVEFCPQPESQAIVMRYDDLGPAVERYSETVQALNERPNAFRSIKSVELQEVYRLNEFEREV